jgi:hypothetical protein
MLLSEFDEQGGERRIRASKKRKRKMKKIILMLVLALSAAAQADLLVNLPQGDDLVTANASCLGLVDGVVAFTTSTLSPASFTGPAFFGGAGGTKPLALWRVYDATPDYLHASISSAPGDQVWALYMFNNQSATITQVLHDVRTTGVGANQTLIARIVVRKDDGSYYISAPKTNPQRFTQTNPGGLAWYEYAPATSLTGVGTLVEGFQLDNVNAIGELIVASNISASNFTMGASTRTFQAWGTIPEPATVGMLGLGTLVTLLIRRLRS